MINSKFNGRDRLDMEVELRVQYCREFFQNSFETCEKLFRKRASSIFKILLEE